MNMVRLLSGHGLTPEWLEWLKWSHRDIELFKETVKAREARLNMNGS